MNYNLLRSPMIFAAIAGVAALLLLSNFGKGNSPAAPRKPGGPMQPVIVELFTSEGCSSCPPADALLKQLSEQQSIEGAQIVALEEHVDYWNHLGWADPFSSSDFSDRQNAYSQVFGRDGVYTPQMVVDGQAEFVGSRSLAAREAIQKAVNQPKLQVALTLDAKSLPDKPVFEIQIPAANGISTHGATELWVAVTESGLVSNVKAGENSGETLKHAAVVRSLRKFDTVPDAAGYHGKLELSLDSQWKRENLALVVFLAEPGSRKIVGAATASLHL